MDVRELGYFVAVFEERSVSAAARRCFVSQPSVSEALASLEHELGARLFVRHRKGAAPTAAGEQLYPLARRLVLEVQSLPALFKPAKTRRRLTLGLMRSLDVARARDLLATVTKDPSVDLVLVNEDEECDLRIVSRSMRKESEVFVPLWEERYVVALPRNHPLAAKPAVRGSDLAGQRLVARCHCENAARFRVDGGRFEVVAVAPTEDWAIALVSAGVGIAIVPEGVLGTDEKPSSRASTQVVVRPIHDVHAKRQVGIAYGAKGPPADVQKLVDALANRAPRGTRRRTRRRSSASQPQR
jgi:DNA-binding transcriptional LysR family regulator